MAISFSEHSLFFWSAPGTQTLARPDFWRLCIALLCYSQPIKIERANSESTQNDWKSVNGGLLVSDLAKVCVLGTDQKRAGSGTRMKTQKLQNLIIIKDYNILNNIFSV